MKLHRTKRTTTTLAATLVLGLTLAACGSDTDGDDNGEAPADAPADTAEDTGAAGGGADMSEPIVLGYIPSWTDGLSTAYLLENQLEAAGYTVEHQEIAEAALLYTGLAEGDIDIYPSAWPEVTHVDYMEQYGDSIEDLGTYYDSAKLTMAVPEYVDIDSIADLAGQADRFDGRIVGIEPGAGLTRVTKESVMPTYGLDDYTLAESSTTAMLAELQAAVDAEEDIVVTLWRPFWANSAFPVKDLEDPEGALGDAEGLHFLATQGFAEEYPEVADWIGQIKLDDDQYGSLEDTVVNEFEGDPAGGVEAWLAENPDVLPSIG
jgi:glycine betaine/proline transport system substrate-binding protein